MHNTNVITTIKQYEILDGLPPYGPMYVAITPKSKEPFFSEGYVLRLFKSDGTSWVANFRQGWTKYNNAFDFPDIKTRVVIAGGQGYIMSPEDEKPKITFGLTIADVIQSVDGSLICVGNVDITVFDNRRGQLWESERISWDGIKDLKIIGDILHGKADDPTNSIQEWSDFSLNLKTKEITGGTYKDFLKRNFNRGVGQSGMISEKKTIIVTKKPWWKIW